MWAAGKAFVLCMQRFACAAVAGGSTSMAAEGTESIGGAGHCNGPINPHEYLLIDKLYESCQAKPLLVLSPLEADNAVVATAKADAVLLSWLAADIQPDVLENGLSTCCYRILLILQKILSAENVKRVFSSNNPVCTAAEQKLPGSATMAASKAEALLAVVNAKIISHLADFDTATFSKTRKNIEGPLDLLLHLFQRSWYLKEPLLQTVSDYLPCILNDDISVHEFYNNTIPILRALIMQNLYGNDVRLELEKAVLRRVATLSAKFYVSLFTRVNFRHPPYILFSAYVLNAEDQYVNPLFMQKYIGFCHEEGLFTNLAYDLLRERFFESDYFFRERLADYYDGGTVISKLAPDFLYPWIFKQFIKDHKADPERESFFQEVMAYVPLGVIADMLEIAIAVRKHASIFINMLQPDFLDQLHSHILDTKESTPCVERICSIMKARMAVQHEMTNSGATDKN